MNRVCSRCKQEFPATFDYFYKDKRRKDGLKPYCKECGREYSSNYRKNNKEKALKRTRNWREKNKEYVSEYNKQYRSENKDKVKDLWKNYYISHKEELSIKCSEYKRANKDRVSSWYRKRVSLKKNTISNFTHSDWIKCQKAFNYQCAYCGKKDDKLTREHFHPLNKGGDYTKSNIIPVCYSCNASKQDTSFFEWYPKQKFYSKEREGTILKYLGYKNHMQQLALL